MPTATARVKRSIPEKDADKNRIDYHRAVMGSIQVVPGGGVLDALREDYSAMVNDGLIASNPPPFGEIMGACTELQRRMNAA